MRKTIFVALIFLALCSLFFVIDPKLSALVFAKKRETQWNNFIAEMKQSKSIDGKKFWEFREFYSPVYFVFERGGLSKKALSDGEKQMDIPHALLANGYPFLQYSSPYINSIESLADEKSLDTISQKIPKDYGTVISQGSDYILVKHKDKVLLIILLSGQEMQKANGFFDYKEKDKALVKGKNWLSISEIILK